MEFKRDSDIALYLVGKPHIVRALQHSNVNKSFRCCIASKKGTKKTVTTPEMIRKVKARFDRNPRRSGRKIARELNILRERMQHILKNEIGLKPLKLQNVQELTDRKKKC